MNPEIFFQQSGANVSRETLERLSLYHDLLIYWNKTYNLIGSSTVDHVWERHFLDSAQLCLYMGGGVQKIVDLGSGAGFPGMVLALLTQIPTCLIESNYKKFSFLKEVKRKTDAPVEIFQAPIQNVSPLRADVVVARALSPLRLLLGYAQRHLHEEGMGLFLKGEDIGKEIEDAQKEWDFSLDVSESKMRKKAVVLRIKQIHRKNIG